jgi:hypothetical protein
MHLRRPLARAGLDGVGVEAQLKDMTRLRLLAGQLRVDGFVHEHAILIDHTDQKVRDPRIPSCANGIW